MSVEDGMGRLGYMSSILIVALLVPTRGHHRQLDHHYSQKCWRKENESRFSYGYPDGTHVG